MMFKSKPRSGAKPKLDKRAMRNLVQIASLDTRMTLKALAMPSKLGKRLNYHTIAIILKSFGKAKH
jgi:hypothetical protein